MAVAVYTTLAVAMFTMQKILREKLLLQEHDFWNRTRSLEQHAAQLEDEVSRNMSRLRDAVIANKQLEQAAAGLKRKEYKSPRVHNKRGIHISGPEPQYFSRDLRRDFRKYCGDLSRRNATLFFRLGDLIDEGISVAAAVATPSVAILDEYRAETYESAGIIAELKDAGAPDEILGALNGVVIDVMRARSTASREVASRTLVDLYILDDIVGEVRR